jgi:hypothetical protein
MRMLEPFLSCKQIAKSRGALTVFSDTFGILVDPKPPMPSLLSKLRKLEAKANDCVRIIILLLRQSFGTRSSHLCHEGLV